MLCWSELRYGTWAIRNKLIFGKSLTLFRAAARDILFELQLDVMVLNNVSV